MWLRCLIFSVLPKSFAKLVTSQDSSALSFAYMALLYFFGSIVFPFALIELSFDSTIGSSPLGSGA